MKKINTILTFHVLAQLPTNALVGHVLAIFVTLLLTLLGNFLTVYGLDTCHGNKETPQTGVKVERVSCHNTKISTV